MIRTSIALDEKLVEEGMKYRRIKTKKDLVDLPSGNLFAVFHISLSDLPYHCHLHTGRSRASWTCGCDCIRGGS